jgi:deoxycytidine triphosphate deaminase
VTTKTAAPPPPLKAPYWSDPLPAWQGMLSSDLIAYYHHQVGGMIEPWDEALLKPASYELTLGEECLVDGKRMLLTDDEPWLEIPENSIVFVSMGQAVRLPHYIAARFDLAIEFIYQGILLGTGPQVDPGFQGVLSCPLHNISSDSVHMRLGQPFAKMDFAKTSGLWKAAKTPSLEDVKDEKDLYARVMADEIEGLDGYPVRLFKADKRWREPIYSPGYAGNKLVRSSVKSLENDLLTNKEEVREFGDEIRRLRRFGLASAIAIVLAIAGLLITLAQLDRSYTDSKVDAVPAGVIRASSVSVERSNILARKLRRADQQITQLRLELNALRRNLRKAGIGG